MAPRSGSATGALAWGLGLLLFAFPIIGSLAAGVAMTATGRTMRRHGEPAASNGRHAANWGLTYLLGTVVLVSLHVILLVRLSADGTVPGNFWMGIPIAVWAVISLAHVAISIAGLLKASRREVFQSPAIPFLRS